MAEKQLLPNVQVLRFLAALSVVAAHTGTQIDRLARRTGGSSLDWTWAPFDLGIGVDVFFVISGFVMFFLMHDRFGERGVAVDFLRRRLIRVVPPYWLVTTVVLVSAWLAGSVVRQVDTTPAYVTASYLFIPWTPADGKDFPVLYVGWTLELEILFYLLFALALRFSKRVGLTILVTLFVALTVLGAVVPDEMSMLSFWGQPIILEFLAGVGLAAVFLSRRRWRAATASGVGLGGLSLAVLMHLHPGLDWLPRLVTMGLPAILVTAAFVLGPTIGRGRFSALVVLGGNASYALYLSHPIAVKVSGIAAGMTHLPLALAWTGSIAVAVLIGFAVHRWVEVPLIQLVSRLVPNARRPMPAATTLPLRGRMTAHE